MLDNLAGPDLDHGLMPTSPTQQLADIKLDGKLDKFVATRRKDGRSWRLIARDLYDETGIDVTHETLRSWYPDDE